VTCSSAQVLLQEFVLRRAIVATVGRVMPASSEGFVAAVNGRHLTVGCVLILVDGMLCLLLLRLGKCCAGFLL
jgi:hypothetical protein